MPFITASDELAKKSFTQIQNKFITKYLPVLDPVAVKVYLYSVYLLQSGSASFTLEDLAKSLDITEEKAKSYYEYLEELELVSVVSLSPFEVKLTDAENVYGTPKKYKPEKYADFTKSVQNILSGRMISTHEFQEYFYFLDEYGFEQNALLMIIKYCVSLQGEKIRYAYIKTVIESFANEEATTAKKVEDKLSDFFSSSPALIKLFNAAGIKKKIDIYDDKLYKKWTNELGFDEDAVICAAKQFKAKTCEKLDGALEELYKNRKFDVKEIEDYCKNKNSVFALTREIAKKLGVYAQDFAPYVENYVNVWCNYGFTFDCLKSVSAYCFLHDMKSFESMHAFIKKLYDDGIVSDDSVTEYIEKQNADEEFITLLLKRCGLTRKVIAWDKESLERWRGWNFSYDMLLAAAQLSAGTSNPMAYMNGVLSSWKNKGIFSVEQIPNEKTTAQPKKKKLTALDMILSDDEE